MNEPVRVRAGPPDLKPGRTAQRTWKVSVAHLDS
jgi:hypothetical protein